MNRRGRRAAVLVSAIAVALFAGEAVIRLFLIPSPTGAWLTTSDQGYGINRPLATGSHTTPDGVARYRINSLGFRGAEPSQQGKRILVVGDSVTFGWLVDEPRTYVAQLAAHSDAVFGPDRASFLNAAVGGWGAADYVAFIEDHGDALRPDVVMVFIGGFDVERSWASPLWMLAPDGSATRRPRTEVRTGIRRMADVPGYRFLVEHSMAAQLARRVALLSAPDPRIVEPDQVAESLALTTGLFARLAGWCRTRGVPLFVTTGTLLEFAPATAPPSATRIFFAQAESLFARLEVPYLSVARAHGSLTVPLASLLMPEDDHPNARGAQLIADTVWPWLRLELRPVIDRPHG